MARASYVASARAMALSASPLAWFYAAQWPDFTPPLTARAIDWDQIHADFHQGARRQSRISDAVYMAAADQMPKPNNNLATQEPSIHGSRPMANALTSVPSTEKCSSDKSGATSRCARIAASTLRATSVVSSRSRFFVNTVGLRPGASRVQG